MSGNGTPKAPPVSNDQSRSHLGEADDGGSPPSQALRFPVAESAPQPSIPSFPQASFPSMPRQPTASFPRPDLASLYRPRARQTAAAAPIPEPSDIASMSPPASMPQPVATAQPVAAAAPAQEDSRRRNPVVVERENFLMFIKILFKILEEAKEPETKSKAQRIVMECRRRSKQGDPNFNPMMEAVERRLRGFVGETKWRRAHLFLHHHISNKHSPARMTTMRRPAALCAGK